MKGLDKGHPFRILQVSTYDIAGGAEKIAWDLFHSYKDFGYQSTLVVGAKMSDDPSILCIPNYEYRSLISKMFISIGSCLDPFIKRMPFGKELNENLKIIGETKRLINRINGIEDFDYPGTFHILEIVKEKPDIVHCHNLHKGYFDLRVLPWLSQQIPVILTLHDAWLLGGHCAHSFDCERWKIGCGHCPDLTIYPEIKRDATAYNWKRKREIYSKTRLYVTTPSQWLMKKVEQSILAPAIIEGKIIPNGVNLSIFHPGNKEAVRAKLGISQQAKVLLFAANGIRNNIWKDYNTMRIAVNKVSERLKGHNLLFIALGENASPERIGQAEIHFVPYQKDPESVAYYYQAADIYIHAARADTFPTTVLEALACGTPVVGTSIGGIPEQIEDEITGFLTPLEDAEAMAERIVQLLKDDELRLNMGRQASDTARKKFDIEKQVKEYLKWYEKILCEGQQKVESKNSHMETV